MTYVNDRVLDSALAILDTEPNALHISVTEPTTYTEAVTTYTIGNKATPTISAPADRTGGGREVTVSAITDGTVTADGTPAYVSLVDTVNSRLLAVAPIGTTEAMLSGDTFTLNSFTIGIPDFA